MHETGLQREIRQSTEPLHYRVEKLEKKLRDLEIMCDACKDMAWKDPKCSALFTSFITKMHSILKRDQ